MKNLLQLIFMLITALLKIKKQGGTKALVAENICLRQQLIILNKNRQRAPNLTHLDRLIFAITTGLINKKRLSRLAILLKPTTLIKIHKAFVTKKYKKLFSNKNLKKPGRKGPSQDIINLVLEFKKRNPRFGYLRISMQIKNQFGIEINSDIVRRILNKYYKKDPSGGIGPSWLTFLGHTKNSLWSIDFFKVESIVLQTHWVMVIMDQFSRKIIGFAVHKGNVTGVDVCCMFNKIIAGKTLPKRISSDNDPLFTFHRWQANLRILNIEEIKSVPYTPISHPFVERLIRSIRNDMLDQTLFWTADDLQIKLNKYLKYYNENRSHWALNSKTPNNKIGISKKIININNYRWEKHLNGLISLPKAA